MILKTFGQDPDYCAANAHASKLPLPADGSKRIVALVLVHLWSFPCFPRDTFATIQLKNGAAIYSDDWAASMPLYIPV